MLKKNRNQGTKVGRSGTPKNQNKTKRVVDIILSREHEGWETDDDIGTIFFTDIGFNQEVKDTLALPRAKPNSLENFSYPLIGELVQIIETTSNNIYEDIGGNISSKTIYYTPALNVHNNITNALPTPGQSKRSKPTTEPDLDNTSDDIKLGTYYKENPNYSPLIPNEGDFIQASKSGGRLRMTNTGNPDTKAIFLGIGSGSKENIINDAATIVMGENLKVNTDSASTNIDSLNSKYAPLSKPLEEIGKSPATVVPQTINNEEFQPQPIEFSFGSPSNVNELLGNLNEATASIPDPDPDPVFAALDEAQEEGLIQFEEEVVDISGTEFVESVVEGQPEVNDVDLEDEEALTQEDYLAINIGAEREWRTGAIATFMNKVGKKLTLLQPTRTLTMVKATKRTPKYLIIHTAGSSTSTTAASLTRFFFNERDGGGWKTGGYHWIIERNGKATRIYSDNVSTNGALGLNQESIHLNWIGGYSKPGEPLNFNIEKGQIFTLKQLINRYIETYPDIKVLGHNQVSNKPCPLFNVPTFCDGIGIDDENVERGIIPTNSGFYSKWDGVVLKDEARRIALLV